MEAPPRSAGILVAESRFPIRHRDRTVDCLCRVTFDMTREPRFLIDCMESLHEIQSGFASPDGSFFLEPSPGAMPLECLIFRMSEQIIGSHPGLRITLLPCSDALVDRGLSLVRVNAAVVNFSQYWFGGPNKLGFCLEDEEWLYEFTPVGDSTLLYPHEIQNESYSFSHHLLLRRRDRAAFPCSEAHRALETLFTFLSFCAEHWSAPTLVAGCDKSGAVVMEDWGSPRIGTRHSPRNWLDLHHGDAMLEIFPVFSRRMADSKWREAIRTAVYWYVRADTNHVGPDGAIILLQAALERLAWYILVQHRRAISDDGFLKLPAADKFRLLLDACSIPLQIPVLLTQLTKAAKAQNAEQDWIDGPQAFVSVRNQLVHPRKPRRLKGARAYYEVLQLGKWYLELVLLRTFGFNGQYANRLKIPRSHGDVELVPWVGTGGSASNRTPPSS